MSQDEKTRMSDQQIISQMRYIFCLMTKCHFCWLGRIIGRSFSLDFWLRHSLSPGYFWKSLDIPMYRPNSVKKFSKWSEKLGIEGTMGLPQVTLSLCRILQPLPRLAVWVQMPGHIISPRNSGDSSFPPYCTQLAERSPQRWRHPVIEIYSYFLWQSTKGNSRTKRHDDTYIGQCLQQVGHSKPFRVLGPPTDVNLLDIKTSLELIRIPSNLIDGLLLQAKGTKGRQWESMELCALYFCAENLS